jgi:hypothetical protein
LKWNKYKITTPSGFVFEICMGEWLKPGDYDFGRVEIVKELSKEEKSEYAKAEEGLCREWGKPLPEEL